MPTPQEGESEEEYIKRCIPIVLSENEGMKGDQASAICHSKFKGDDAIEKAQPFARFPSIDACTTEMKEIGHSIMDASKICTGILERALKGALLKAQTNGLEMLSKAGDNDIILGGYASWAITDADGDFFTVEAQQKALERFFKTAPEYQLITINHGRGIAGEVNIARPMLKAVGVDGKEYFSHVNEAGTYLVSKLRNDDLKVTQYYRQKARAGDLNGYSVNAFVLARDSENKVTEMEYSAITITEKGVATPKNPKTRDVVVLAKASENEANTPTQMPQKPDLTTEEILQRHGFNKTVT